MRESLGGRWLEAAGVGRPLEARRPRSLQNAIADTVDRFINANLEQNPKQ